MGSLNKTTWLAFISCAWLESLNGSAYAFGSYSQALKLALNLDQKSLDTLGFFKDLGSSCGILPSLLFDRIPTWAIVVLGLLHSTFGYSLTWVAIENPSLFGLWQLCAFQFVAGSAQTFIQTAALVMGLRIFPQSRGFVVGFLKGFLGISASILVQFFMLVCNGKEKCFPLMFSWLLPALSVLPVVLLREFERKSHGFEGASSSSGSFRILTGILVALAVYLFGVLVLEDSVSLGRKGTGMICVGMLVILLLPLWVVFKSTSECDDVQDELLPKTLLPGKQAEESSDQADEERMPVAVGDEYTVKEAMTSVDFWLLFLIVVLASGSCAGIDNNFSQLGHSLGYSQHTITICVSLFSVWSCLGRLGSGLISEHFLHKHGTPRLVFLLVSLFCLVTALLVGGFGLPGALYMISLLGGVGEGALWCLSVTVASELFGMASFSTILNVVTFACPVGAYGLSVMVVGYIYDSQAGAEDGLLCYGARCFRDSFIVLAFCCFLAGVACSMLTHRSRTFYHKQIHLHRL